jgi:hypothetical protein
MRHAKNSLVVNRKRDIPLLYQVRSSKFITHQQLFEFMKLCGHERSRASFDWRVRRLIKFGRLAICPDIQESGSAVYRITKSGLALLEHFGQASIVLNSGTLHPPHSSQAFHALGINAIQLALTRANLVASWQSEIEVAAFNMISHSPFQKDYDAIVEVWVGEKTERFALEYERTLKSITRYGQVRAALQAERELHCILYLTSGLELVAPLVQELGDTNKRVGFATLRDFEKSLLDTVVFSCQAAAMVKFREFLSNC